MIRRRRPPDLPACIDALAAVHAVEPYPVRWQRDPGRWLTPAALCRAWGWRRLGTVRYDLHGEQVPMHCYAAPELAPEPLPGNTFRPS